MRYLHTMLRVRDLDAALDFFCTKLGLQEQRRVEVSAGRFTLVFLAAPETPDAQIELTHNWDAAPLDGGRNFGHIAFEVENIYETCERLAQHGVVILRPPRDGRMAFVRSPDEISIELLQRGSALPAREPWLSMPNTGEW